MKKKGAIELQFNWIFVLIAGAIIFLFFISIVNKQREFSDIKTSGTIATNLDSILTGAQVSTNTVNLIEMPKVDIGFECNRYFIGPVPKQTKSNVIFAPNLLKGKKMVTWALDWNTPYRITNFLYITDPQVRYIIVNKTDRPAEKVFEELPKEMNKEITPPSTAPINKNNYKVKFIFFDDKVDNVLDNLRDMSDEDVGAIVIKDATTSNIIPNTGTIEFFQKDSNTNKWESKGITYYLKQESLFGAIFAEDIDMYDCAMRKAFKKLNLVSKIYLTRSTNLMSYYGITDHCYTQHDTDKLKGMIENSAIQSEEFPRTIDEINAIQNTITGINNQNHNAQIFSCALIY